MTPRANNGPRPVMRTALLCSNPIQSRIVSAASYASAAYVYQPASIVSMELTTAQSLVLGLLHSLVKEDMVSCRFLAGICSSLPQLHSRHLRVWLEEDFQFPQQDIKGALTSLAHFLTNDALQLPHHVVELLIAIAPKYDVSFFFPCSVQKENVTYENHLERAVVNNSPGDIIALAMSGGNVNWKKLSGDSLFHLAVSSCSTESIVALGYLQADVEVLNSAEVTPLQQAVIEDNVPAIEALLLAGADITKLHEGDTVMHLAVARDNYKALQALLQAGVGVDVKNNLGETPLKRALSVGNSKAVELLLKKGANRDVANIIEAARTDCLETVELLILCGLKSDSTDEEGCTPLHVTSNPNIVRTLVAAGCPINSKTKCGKTPLHLSSAKGTVELITSLLNQGAAIEIQDDNGDTALQIAVANANVNVVKLLLDTGANPHSKNNLNWTPLHQAAKVGCEECVIELVDSGADVNPRDCWTYSPAHLAARHGRLTVLQILAELGADLKIMYNDEIGLLHLAALGGHLDTVDWLIQANFDVNMRGRTNTIPLYFAIGTGRVEVVKLLLIHHSDVRIRTAEGWTVLHQAARFGSFPIVKMLIEFDVPILCKTNKGLGAVDIAMANKHPAIVSYLKSYNVLQRAKLQGCESG